MFDGYDTGIRYADEHVGRILAQLADLNVLEETAILISADHGEMLGSHGMHSKGVFYEESAHVPLLMRLPGAIRPGTAVENPVTHADLFPTILDYLGAPERACDGSSLRALIEGHAGYPDFCVSEWNPASPNRWSGRETEAHDRQSRGGEALDALFN
jgi:arylsulfatase A-like enzyme